MQSKVGASRARSLTQPQSGLPQARSAVFDCAAQPQETQLKIQLIGPFKGSSSNSYKTKQWKENNVFLKDR